MTMQADLLLECTDIITVPVESVLLLPKIGTKVVCKYCRTEKEIIRVSRPYSVEHNSIKPEKGQGKLGE